MKYKATVDVQFEAADMRQAFYYLGQYFCDAAIKKSSSLDFTGRISVERVVYGPNQHFVGDLQTHLIKGDKQ